MSTGLGVAESVRALLLLLPRVVGRIKRSPIPPELAAFALAPRHLSLFAYLQFDGPMPVNELATRLEVAPATTSLMISELSRMGLLARSEDPADRRRTIVSIAEDRRAAVESWLAASARAWHVALEPLTDEQRHTFVETLGTFERELNRE